MFTAYKKETGQLVEILAVNRGGDKTEFLVWEEWEWKWLDAELFEKQ